MAPRRQAKVVVRSTKKIVRETVQVAVVQYTEGDGTEEEEERVVTEIPIEELSEDEKQKQPSKVQVPVEAPGENRVQQEPKPEPKEAKNGKRKIGKKKGFDGNEGYMTYVFRVLKQVHPGMTISSKAMSIINSLMNDMFDKITNEATKLSKYTERKTLSSREIQGDPSDTVLRINHLRLFSPVDQSDHIKYKLKN